MSMLFDWRLGCLISTRDSGSSEQQVWPSALWFDVRWIASPPATQRDSLTPGPVTGT